MGTIKNYWKIDHIRFRVYLQDKYKVENAYYFMGYYSNEEEKLYNKLQLAGYILVFKNHKSTMISLKKGNVDVDIVFNIMKNLLENKNFNKIVLVSGDGDYRNLVDYLIKKGRFEKILFPNKKFASSLSKNFRTKYFDYLDNIKEYIEHK